MAPSPKPSDGREVSRRRRGLIGGSGGAAPAPLRLFERDRDPLRDPSPLLMSGGAPECGKFMVGTRLVDMTKVGSEISRLSTKRFFASATFADGPKPGC